MTIQSEKDPAARKRQDYFIKYHMIADLLSADLVLRLDEALFHIQTLEGRADYLDAVLLGFGGGMRYISGLLENKPPEMEEIQKTWVNKRKYKNEEESEPQN